MRMSGSFTNRPKSELVNTLPLAEIIHPALTGVACQDADWTAGLAPQWGLSEICSFVTQHDATDVAGFEGERNYHVHNHRPRVTTPPPGHLKDRLRTATRTSASTIGLQNQTVPLQNVRNSLGEAHLDFCHPHWSPDLNALCHYNRFDMENAQVWLSLAHWRGVLYAEGSRFSLLRLQTVCVALCGWCWCYKWSDPWRWMTMICYQQWTQVYFIDGILNTPRYPVSLTFTSCCRMMMYDPGSGHSYWKLITSQFIFGMLWIGVFYFLPTSSNFPQSLETSGPTSHRPPSTTCQ